MGSLAVSGVTISHSSFEPEAASINLSADVSASDLIRLRDTQGKVTKWSFEMGSPGGLQNRGWKKADLKQGDAVTVDGYASKKQALVANARNVELPGGRKLFGGFASTPGNPNR
jgi:hypothetical protein